MKKGINFIGVLQVFCLIAFVSAPVFADPANEEKIKKALDSFCDKMMQCALETMGGGEDLPKSMLDMFTQQVGMQCRQFVTFEETTSKDDKLTEMGVICLNDMSAMPCDNLTMGEEPKSCQVFKEAESQ